MELSTRAACPNLVRALARARADINPVGKDGKTSGAQSYRFASAQAIMMEAGPVLARHGLVYMPVVERFDEESMMLHREYMLAHESGESITIPRNQPVVVIKYSSGNSTAIDKALGAARTVDYRYALRDLLCIPQVDDTEEIEHRSDDGERQRGRPERSEPRTAERQQTSERTAERQQTSERTAEPQQTAAVTSAERQAEHAEMLARIAKGRAYLGDSLVRQLGLAGEPKTADDAARLLELLGEAARKKMAAEKAKPQNGSTTAPSTAAPSTAAPKEDDLF